MTSCSSAVIPVTNRGGTPAWPTRFADTSLLSAQLVEKCGAHCGAIRQSAAFGEVGNGIDTVINREPLSIENNVKDERVVTFDLEKSGRSLFASPCLRLRVAWVIEVLDFLLPERFQVYLAVKCFDRDRDVRLGEQRGRYKRLDRHRST